MAQALHHFGSKTSIPQASMHITYNINSGTSVNLTQEYVNIIYIYKCPYLFLTFYKYISRNNFILLCINLPENGDLSLKHVGEFMVHGFLHLRKLCAFVGVGWW